jgi:RNAse (barnase) inhibitor barstar
MEENKCVVLDLTGCDYLGELHRRIKEAFDFPEYYGENWDAFYDLICTDSKAEMIIILGKNEMSKSLEAQFERMCKTIDDAKCHLAGYGISLEYKIEE